MFKKLILLLLLIFVALCIYLLTLYSQIRDDVKPIVDYKPALTTKFIDRNGKLIANIFNKKHRLYVQFNDIPARIIESLIAIEDTQFFEHNGINVDAIIRAIVKDIKHLKLVEGASTITQQLVRTLALSRDKKIVRKLKEIMLSLRVETLLTKEQILQRYLNEVYFGHGYYGIRTASNGYFHKELYELTLKEMAILVGLPQAPSFYDPTKNLKYSLARANQVIRRLKVLGWIDQTQHDEAINFIPEIFNDTLTQNKAPYVVDYALKILGKDIKDIKSSGYTVQLTIDLQSQKIAKEALKFGYDKIKQRDEFKDTNETTSATLNGAILNIKNDTGEILSLVGGVDYAKSPFNRVTQSKRQPGSAVKPFIYQTALNIGYSTISDLVDISRTYEYEDKNITDDNNITKKWKPSNYETNFKGIVSLDYALMHSRNLATINLVNEIGIDIVYKNLRFYGFKDIPFDLSITLGSFSISVLELSSLYTIFSNHGIKNNPYIIQSIKKDGKLIFQNSPDQTYIQNKEQSFLMTSILQNTIKRGTGRRAGLKGIELAGKTGTTNKNKDAWFCGYSPTIQTIVWFGNDDNTPMYKRETGGISSAPVFKYYYKHYLQVHPEIKRKFDIPKNVKMMRIDNKDIYHTSTSPLPKDIQTNQLKKMFPNQIEF